MLQKLSELIAADANYKAVVKSVFDEPYKDKKTLLPLAGVDAETFDRLIEVLEEAMIVLALTAQQDSSIESRVPKKVFLINPEIEYDIEELLT
ncbi:hypothetical protein LJC34_07815 [Oscillospiraceae bacterium OttesenSCG-928-G22]|nr:hypothetical protein [Oscillospiraceae bacterium OttesenSCG-928-G22]